MINAILKGILNFLSGLITFVLSPLDNYIRQWMPDFADVLQLVSSVFNFISQTLGWVVDSFCIPSVAISFVLLTFTFRLNIRIVTHGLRLAVKWWDKLVP